MADRNQKIGCSKCVELKAELSALKDRIAQLEAALAAAKKDSSNPQSRPRVIFAAAQIT